MNTHYSSNFAEWIRICDAIAYDLEKAHPF